VQPFPLPRPLQQAVQGLEDRRLVSYQGQRALERIDRSAEIFEVFLANPRDALVQAYASIGVEARTRLCEQDVDQLGPSLQARRQSLSAIENLIVVRPLADRLQQGVERRIRVLTPALVNIGQGYQLLGLLKRIGHGIGAQSKQRRQVVPTLLRSEVGLEDGRCVLAIIGELGDAKQRLHRRLVLRIEAEDLTVYRDGAQLVVELPLQDVAELMGQLDTFGLVRRRIGPAFLFPGVGYGGSCFPKDVKALEHTAQQIGYTAELLRAVESVNNRQKQTLFHKIDRHFKGNLGGKVIAVWGLAFKPNTDDMREAPSRVLMEALWNAGARVRAYDPEAMQETRRIYGDDTRLVLCESPDDALIGADALAIVTEWNAFRSPDFNRMKDSLKHPVIFDGRNLYNPDIVEKAGLVYYSIGRGKQP